tara:strand:+ start:281 stop:436 length:156 start_codon:yes stop_codon:yes gene_type:complete
MHTTVSTEGWKIEMFDGWMISRAVTVGLHPTVVTGIEVDGRDALIRRLDER